jgi:hypothetical protein
MEDGKLEWFGGDENALKMYRSLIFLAHAWDDLVDKDKDLSEQTINQAFMTALVWLPTNPFYRAIQDSVFPMWVVVVSSYEVANRFERDKDAHGLEIAHGLRYAAGNIIAYAMHVCLGDKARDYLPEMWKNVFFERFDDYRQEHLKC